jgi:hypothetical protein
MKTILKVVTVGVIAALTLVTAPAKTYAGDREWATVGKVLTGIAAVGFIAAIASQHDADVAPAGYCAPPPPPARCEPPPPRWIPGHYEVRRERVCVPGYWDTIVTPAEYAWVRHGCHWRYVEVRPACERRVWVPERVECRETQVWVPGCHDVAQRDRAHAWRGYGNSDWNESED